MAETLNIELSKVQLPNGSWIIYYDGSDLDLPCGTQYLTVVINGEEWFSELFTVKNITSGIHPELIKDKSHTALRFYDNKLKQNYFKCRDLCDIGVINPIDHIIPFVIDVTGLTFDPGLVETKIICHDGRSELDLSGEVNYTVNNTTHILFQDGGELSGQLMCGIYYLQVKINDSYYYSEHFKVENITNVPITNIYLYTESDTETGFEQIITEDEEQSIIL